MTDKRFHSLINECSESAQKYYKTREDWVGSVIHWELCKRLKFDYADVWYTQIRICPRKWNA